MKQTVLTVLAVCALATAPAFAAQDMHQHGHDAHGATLQLNAGKKWETDAALRKDMGAIRQSMASSLDAIHANKMPPQAYAALARKVEDGVADMVANCKLAPAADAQLHVVVAELLAGAEHMAGKAKSGTPQDGAVKVIGALNNYGKYFDDPDFQPISH
ncbi:hypothetical protein H3H36_24305 [Duganella sp. FT3S]|uniref:DnrO protein n=1 Tax=Rugamonas fusca TaxID=2758568 RepID=A0A7W2EM60_9BURK|nr:hypothetical protein [Rugamonas fusca]MBA5608475.1 hypothetical protein [Rugamonas fusca]